MIGILMRNTRPQRMRLLISQSLQTGRPHPDASTMRHKIPRVDASILTRVWLMPRPCDNVVLEEDTGAGGGRVGGQARFVHTTVVLVILLLIERDRVLAKVFQHVEQAREGETLYCRYTVVNLTIRDTHHDIDRECRQ